MLTRKHTSHVKTVQKERDWYSNRAWSKCHVPEDLLEFLKETLILNDITRWSDAIFVRASYNSASSQQQTNNFSNKQQQCATYATHFTLLRYMFTCFREIRFRSISSQKQTLVISYNLLYLKKRIKPHFWIVIIHVIRKLHFDKGNT